MTPLQKSMSEHHEKMEKRNRRWVRSETEGLRHSIPLHKPKGKPSPKPAVTLQQEALNALQQLSSDEAEELKALFGLT